MITDEEIKRIAVEITNPMVKNPSIFTFYEREIYDFARAIYQLGRQHQRESDTALCFKLAEPEYLPSMHEYTEAGMCYAECEEVILANTGELK